MERLSWLLIITCLLGCVVQTDKDILWIKQGGGIHYDAGRKVIVNDENKIFVVGSSQGESTFNGIKLEGKDDQIILLKYDEDGLINWAKSFGGNSDDIGYGITLNKNNEVLITGHFSDSAYFDSTFLKGKGAEDIFVAKIDDNGSVIWVKSIGGLEKDFGRGITSNVSNEIFVTGYCMGDMFCDSNLIEAKNGKENLCLVKLDDKGKFMFGKTFFSTNGNIRAHNIKSLNNGNLVIAGYFEGSLFLNDTLQLKSIGKADAFVILLDVNGNVLWAKNFGSKSWDETFDLTFDETDNIYLTGFSGGTTYFETEEAILFEGRGNRDIFIIKLNATGKLVWAMNYGGTGIDEGRSIAYYNNRLLVTGFYEKEAIFDKNKFTSNGLPDIFTVEMNIDGKLINSYSFGGKEGDEGRGITFAKDGNAILTGRIKNQASFGKIKLKEAKDGDLFITKINLKVKPE